MAITLKTRDEIERMRAAGRIVCSVLNRCREICKPGTTTLKIDEEAERIIQTAGGRGLFKNYPTYRAGEGFPSTLCISVRCCSGSIRLQVARSPHTDSNVWFRCWKNCPNPSSPALRW